jgi:hypothetical protein
MTGQDLSLPERLVYAAEQAITEIAATVFRGVTGVESIEGYPTDLAKVAAAATVEALAEALKDWLRLCCGLSPDAQCFKCGQLYSEIGELHALAVQVREVRPVEVV